MKLTLFGLGKAEVVFINLDPENIFCVAAEGYTTHPGTFSFIFYEV